MIELVRPLLIHEVTYKEFVRENRNHEPEYSEPQLITKVRVDYERNSTKNKSEQTFNLNAIMFMYNGLTKPFTEMKEKSVIVFGKEELLIHKVIPVYEPYKNELLGYEVELL